MNRLIATVIAGLLAAPVLADGHAAGDAEAGAKEFNKCKSCHMIVDADGAEIVKGGRTGPNLWGIVGRQAGTIEGFRYGDDLVAAGEAGLIWDEANFVSYVEDPRAFLRTYLDDNSARSKMTFKLRKGGADVWAYLASVSPAPEATEATN
ncbi:cytochrome C [Aestuariivita sp.]|jgi:cytochrome c|uniref:c-type cytochrome n=1 Tax=Aestuariivita sp. TaxID=1872407 RepID=UPI00216F82BD|nr:cytochrome C [Aestuariivita sp.]MCE8009715.1 cytochrome C [Aestuariivita sp.]